MADPRPDREVYTQRNNPAFEALVAKRKAAEEAAFFLPHLRPGMRVLDVAAVPSLSLWGWLRRWLRARRSALTSSNPRSREHGALRLIAE